MLVNVILSQNIKITIMVLLIHLHECSASFEWGHRNTGHILGITRVANYVSWLISEDASGWLEEMPGQGREGPCEEGAGR